MSRWIVTLFDSVGKSQERKLDFADAITMSRVRAILAPSSNVSESIISEKRRFARKRTRPRWENGIDHTTLCKAHPYAPQLSSCEMTSLYRNGGVHRDMKLEGTIKICLQGCVE